MMREGSQLLDRPSGENFDDSYEDNDAVEETSDLSRQLESDESNEKYENKSDNVKIPLSDQSESKPAKLEKLKRYISEADSINELCEILSLQSLIVVDDGFLINTSNEVYNIKEANEFLEDNLDEIVSGAINKGATYYRDLLGAKVKLISDSGELGIRQKVKELMKKRMAEEFVQHKKRFVEHAVIRVQSFSQLFEVIDQFKSVNVEDEGGQKISSAQAISLIQRSLRDLHFLLKDDEFLRANQGSIEKNLDNLTSAVPRDSGIRDKVYQLMDNQVKEIQLINDARRLNEGLGTKIKKGFKRFFRRD